MKHMSPTERIFDGLQTSSNQNWSLLLHVEYTNRTMPISITNQSRSKAIMNPRASHSFGLHPFFSSSAPWEACVICVCRSPRRISSMQPTVSFRTRFHAASRIRWNGNGTRAKIKAYKSDNSFFKVGSSLLTQMRRYSLSIQLFV
jgi:hypothetical protein